MLLLISEYVPKKMNLQTKIPLKKQSKNLIDYNSSVLLLGSCFSENIGDKLNYFKFSNQQNPLGILFHPKAIETLIFKAVNKKKYLKHDVFFHNEQWHCFDAHSILSNSVKLDLLSNLNTQIELTNTHIKKATHIIITLGTAWVYQFCETGRLVANCHKIPQNQFSKAVLPVADILNALINIEELIYGINTDVNLIFTVSPIRHIKDGYIENMQSKAHLITAIHEFLSNKKGPIVNSNSFYFPSYEIMMDELRDYRFYKEDMIHPNTTAIRYIWERFKAVWIDEKALKIMEEVDAIQKGLLHKPFNSKSQAHQIFLQKLEVKKNNLKAQYPHFAF